MAASFNKKSRKPEPAVYRYFILNKPYGVVSQFIDHKRKTRKLRSVYDFPEDVYPVGRLDKDSEGLLLLTNDRAINNKLLRPENAHEREYWVQVHGHPTDEALQAWENGITIHFNKQTHDTRPAKAEILDPQPEMPKRERPISPRGPYPIVWMRMVLTEGKNRQVRRMTGKLGYPTLRLFRKRIARLSIDTDELPIGEVREVPQDYIYDKLFNEAPEPLLHDKQPLP